MKEIVLTDPMQEALAQSTDERCGKIVKAMIAFSKTGTQPVFEDDNTLAAMWPLVREYLSRQAKTG